MSAPVAEADLLAASSTVITALAGPGAVVRPDQLEAVRALVVERRRALVVQATGWGKSAVYWIAARAVRDAGGGPVLVVSPLLALMGDQVAAAERAGLRAATLNSSNLEDWSAIEQDVLSGRVDVLLVSPERLANPRFAAGVLETLLPRLGLLVIDEAHCISSWGHDFRPDYQRIAALLLANPGLPVLATTATANARVTADVAAQLGPSTFVQRGRLARESLHLGVAPGLSAVSRYAWIDEALQALPGSGIVYCLTVADAERLTEFLAFRGHEVASYTGRTEPAERVRVEAALRANAVKAVVATSALGMGYDKPDLAFCLHVGSPGSPVDYYQQVGRAGRALESAVVVLLPSETDARLWEWFATASVPVPDDAAAVLRALDRRRHEQRARARVGDRRTPQQGGAARQGARRRWRGRAHGRRVARDGRALELRPREVRRAGGRAPCRVRADAHLRPGRRLSGRAAAARARRPHRGGRALRPVLGLRRVRSPPACRDSRGRTR